jgi:thiol-disulfide isomerase/thioredoxin
MNQSLRLGWVVASVLWATSASCSSARRNTTADEERPHVADAPANVRGARVLRVGDRAPALAVEQWVKGEPIAALEEDKLYVVVFWATWCPPCRTTLAHITALQRDHAAVTFVAVAASEKPTPSGADERAAGVQEFVARQKSRIDCRVAYDGSGKSRQAWADEAGEELLPRALVVGRDGRIEWIGHPMELEPELQAILVGER